MYTIILGHISIHEYTWDMYTEACDRQTSTCTCMQTEAEWSMLTPTEDVCKGESKRRTSASPTAATAASEHDCTVEPRASARDRALAKTPHDAETRCEMPPTVHCCRVTDALLARKMAVDGQAFGNLAMASLRIGAEPAHLTELRLKSQAPCHVHNLFHDVVSWLGA